MRADPYRQQAHFSIFLELIPSALSRPIVGSDESCDGAVKLVDS